MATTQQDKQGPVILGPWAKGMNNVKPDYSLGVDELRQITNFDVDDAGYLRSRKGYTLVYTGTNRLADIWASKDGTVFLMDGDTLKVWNPATNVATTIRSGCGLGVRMFFVEPGDGRIYYSNGQITGTINKSGASWVDGLWGSLAPFLSASATSDPNTVETCYQILATSVDVNGRESGTVVIPIVVNALPVTLTVASPNATKLHIYSTEKNGTVFLRQGTITGASGSYTLRYIRAGTKLRTHGLAPFPPAQLLQWYKGSILGASGNLLFFSPALMYDLFDPSKGYLQFESDIRLIAAMDNGFYVATENDTSWITGNITDGFQRVVQAPYGAAFGSLCTRPDNTDVVWFGPKGFVMGNDDGKVEAVHADTVAVDAITESVGIVKEQDGLRQAIVTPIASNFDSPFVIGDYAEAEVRRANTEV